MLTGRKRQAAAFRGKVALLTGTSRGIGQAVARRLTARGAKVALVARSGDDLRSLAHQLGPSAAAFPCDIRDRHQVDAAVGAAVNRFGGLDIVFANAGLSEVNVVEQVAPASLQRLLDTNLFGTLHTLQATLPHLLSSRGYFLATASLAAVSSSPGFGVYSATKSGVIALVDALRVEMYGRGVDVGILLPGIINTKMLQDALMNDGCRILVSDRSRLLRPVDPDRIAAAVEKGIRQRARRIVYPRVLWPMAAVPGLVNNPLATRLAFPPKLIRQAVDAITEHEQRQQTSQVRP
jgi:NADP-dependent 3-hydroxy acid dehydrogenase YdfG